MVIEINARACIQAMGIDYINVCSKHDKIDLVCQMLGLCHCLIPPAPHFLFCFCFTLSLIHPVPLQWVWLLTGWGTTFTGLIRRQLGSR